MVHAGKWINEPLWQKIKERRLTKENHHGSVLIRLKPDNKKPKDNLRFFI